MRRLGIILLASSMMLALPGCGGIQSAGSTAVTAVQSVVNPENLYRIESAYNVTLNLVNVAADTGLLKKNSPAAVKVSKILRDINNGIVVMRITTDAITYQNQFNQLEALIKQVPAIIAGAQ